MRNNGHVRPPDTTKYENPRTNECEGVQINAREWLLTTTIESCDQAMAVNSFQIKIYRKKGGTEVSDQTIPWNDPQKWVEVGRFFKTIDQKHRFQFMSVRQDAQSIGHRLDELSHYMETLCTATCITCQDICCKKATIWYDFKDLLYFYFAFGRLPDRQIIKENFDGQSEGHCCQLSPTGCALSRLERPFVCTWYLCPDQKELLAAESHGETLDVNMTLNEIKMLRHRMETAFCQISAGQRH